MAFIAPILPFLGAGLGVVSAISESNTQQANLQSAALADDNNALAAKQQAATVQQQAGVEEEAQRKKARAVMGEQRAAFAQAGSGLNSVSNQGLAVQSAFAAEQDALNIRYGGLLEAHGLREQANRYQDSARNNRAQAKAVRASGYLKAIAGGLSGYTSGGGTFKRKVA